MPWITFKPSNSGKEPPHLQVRLILAGLVLLFAFRCYRTWQVFNDTADEGVHVSCGLEIWEKGRYRMEAQHPPLARAVLALPAYLGGLRNPKTGLLWTDTSTEFYWRSLILARAGNLVFAPLLFAYVFAWASRLYGPAAGVVAAALLSFSPNLLAHASLATLDFGATTTIFISAYYFWRWSREPGLRRCLVAALAFGIAVLTKFSALFFLPPVAALFFLLNRRPLRPSARSAGLFVLVAASLIWAGYLFDAGHLPSEAQFPPPAGTYIDDLERGAQKLGGSRDIPAPMFFRGLLDVVEHNAQGHQAYLLGELGQMGWWYYFPVVLAVKTTLPMLLLVLGGLVLWTVSRGRGRTPALLQALTPAAVILAICMRSNLNMGVRHILPVYPFLALVAAALFATGSRGIVAAALALGIWHGIESLAAHPDYLPYFNQIARGREDYFLLDNNLDWGQDLERLRRFLEAKGIRTVYLSYFGRAHPARLLTGVEIRPLPPDLRPSGWVAVSKAHIVGLALKGYDLGWLKAHTPAAVVGRSILVYHFP